MDFEFDPQKKTGSICRNTGLILKKYNCCGRILIESRSRRGQPMSRVLLSSESLPVNTGRLYIHIVVSMFVSFQPGDRAKRRSNSMKAKEFDKKFDTGKGILNDLDLTRAKRPGQEQKRVNVDFPVWMIHRLDKEARRLGVPQQSLINFGLPTDFSRNRIDRYLACAPSEGG